MSLKDGLLAEFDHEIATTRKLLERLPDEKLAWKPHAKSMALGELATHLSNLPQWTATIMNDTSFDLEAGPMRLVPFGSRAEVLRHLESVAVTARAALEKTDAEYMAPWTLKRGGHEMFTMPRLATLRTFVLSHLVHHRGQLSVYLRLLDVPVPAIYGPSADEG